MEIPMEAGFKEGCQWKVGLAVTWRTGGLTRPLSQREPPIRIGDAPGRADPPGWFDAAGSLHSVGCAS